MTPKQSVADLLPKLRSDRVTYFPIRHHSPACAAHLQRWIAGHKPASVLIEGPESFNTLVELLVDERCISPIAIYTNYVDKCNRLGGGADEESANVAKNLFGPPRFAAFYPLCDYSPELVALRSGHAVKARLRFIDLDYPEMVLAGKATLDEKDTDAVCNESLTTDPHLQRSDYIQSLSRKLGCRDFNELWDHLFESCWDTLDTDAFVDRLAAWCALARLDFTDKQLQQDGTAAREACMAAAVCEELARNAAEKRNGPVLVVTGGFHTVPLPDLVADNTKRPKRPSFEKEETGTWLMRYSFDQLDALAGYASGMPSPEFYDRMWSAGSPNGQALDANRTRAAVDLIVEVGRLTRERKLPAPISTPDAIAAVQMAKQLAKLRGHAWPLREDVLDGVRSCFVKGELETEGQLILRLVQDVFAGNRVGRTPPHTGAPPIVHDFNQQARRLRLPVDTVEQRDLTLDLYRKVNHREISRLLHRLELIAVPFASFQGGPDFITGHGLELMQEHWQVGWSPATEGALIEASVYGPTLEEAAAARLQQLIACLEEEGEGRSAAAAVAMLVRACRLGLHRQASAIAALVGVHIAGDPDFPSVVSGLSQLELLSRSREPLEATHLSAVPNLMETAYLRACHLLNEVAGCPDEMVDEVINALKALREVFASVAGHAGKTDAASFDVELFIQGLRRVVGHAPQDAQAAVVGAAAGLLYSEGVLADNELVRITTGYLGGTAAEAKKSSAVLFGLLATAREIAWQVSELMRAVDRQFAGWDENTFHKALPDLRLAFADLTPKEIARVADNIAGIHGESSLGELVHIDLEESEVEAALEINRMVRESLAADGLNW